MTSYPGVYEFNPQGLHAFKRIFEGSLGETAINPIDSQFAARVTGTKPIGDEPAETSKEMAQRVLSALGPSWREHLSKPGIWAWLTFVLRDIVLPRDAHGKRKLGELHRWFPSDANDYQKAQRHLVRMPVVLLGDLGDAADHLLCGDPSVPGDVREQLTAQQVMFSREFQQMARTLYFDPAEKKLKRGSAGKGGGSARRLRAVRRQLDVTWNLFDLDAPHIVQLLPKEFDRFKPAQS
ncbi:MAG: hypothetical protein WC804_11130 [Sphingomonas sp.]|jgi:hypothetical protein|uniref:hypothetical protein n=1 Tax=Sphingomonas sp. TaxID=28214 RepID=UPI0035633B66